MEVLEIRGLNKRYGERAVVSDVELSIGRGECLALLGPNGAGKTTLCEMLSGLVRADSGQIRILGRSMPEERERVIQHIGVQLQHTDLYGRYTVRETLQLFASFYLNPMSVSQVMADVGLVPEADRMLRKLSGGQKQRVFLGCALIHNPDLIFLDEPTTGLDPQARRSVWELVRKLKREGRSILLSTHFMEEAEALADRIAVMHQGRIIACGSADHLKEQFCPGVNNSTLEEVFFRITGEVMQSV
jgi:ABC-2 type transport system ATP-binding protein